MLLKGSVANSIIKFFDKLHFYFSLSKKIDNLFKDAGSEI